LKIFQNVSRFNSADTLRWAKKIFIPLKNLPEADWLGDENYLQPFDEQETRQNLFLPYGLPEVFPIRS